MNIEEKLLTINPYSRPATKLNSHSKIVIHYVGNAGSSAIGNRNYFESLKNKKIYASSHYIVGLNGEIIKCIPEDEVAYHAGNYTVNCNSIGIEVCHPDVTGIFSDITKNALKELVQDLVARYGIKEENILRHFDIIGKLCPLAYVNDVAWAELKAFLLSKKIDEVKIIEEKGTEEKPMLKFKNGKTVEPIYADCNHTVKIGSLNKYEECECFGIFNGAPMVRYQVGSTGNYKIGFAVDTRCVK